MLLSILASVFPFLLVFGGNECNQVRCWFTWLLPRAREPRRGNNRRLEKGCQLSQGRGQRSGHWTRTHVRRATRLLLAMAGSWVGLLASAEGRSAGWPHVKITQADVAAECLWKVLLVAKLWAVLPAFHFLINSFNIFLLYFCNPF